MERVLAVGSHFDDIEIGCGGSLLKHKNQGDSITLAILKSDENLTGEPGIRLREQYEVVNILSASLFVFESNTKIEQIVYSLDNVCPTILYFPFHEDSHQDHIIASKVGYAVSRNVYGLILKYLTTTSHSYYPNYLRVIDIEEKKKLVSLFKSQMERRPKFMEIMEAQNRFFGSLIPGNGHFAEGFILHRMVVI